MTTYFTDFEDKEHAIISNEDGSVTTMLKSTYDEMIARNEASTL